MDKRLLALEVLKLVVTSGSEMVKGSPLKTAQEWFEWCATKEGIVPSEDAGKEIPSKPASNKNKQQG